MAVGYSAALSDLGFGGSATSPYSLDSEEERKKRLLRAQQLRQLSPAASALGLGAAGAGLFGGGNMGIGQV